MPDWKCWSTSHTAAGFAGVCAEVRMPGTCLRADDQSRALARHPAAAGALSRAMQATGRRYVRDINDSIGRTWT